jgi:GntR family transcriptional regulator
MQYDSRPIYKQIAEYLHDLILNGEWANGERIPSIREMAVQMEVNPNTMNRTYSLLQEQELIYNKRGIGYFTADKAQELTTILKKREFIKKELPDVFRKMDALHISPEEILRLYQENREKS